MNLIELTPDAITIGRPLPFPLRDENGVLLARRGFVIDSRDDLEALLGRGRSFYVDAADSERHQKAYVGKLYELVADEKPLGKIAQTRLSTRDLGLDRTAATDEHANWVEIQDRGNRLLRELSPSSFVDELERLHVRLSQECRRNPDGALFALFTLASSELRQYSATHAMLVSVVCVLAARDVLGWPEDQVSKVCKAALTMNVSMTGLQDRLAAQLEAPVAEQRQLIASHAARSVELLKGLGVLDPDWLEAVGSHHATQAGGLAERTPAQRVARLIQRSDMFTARMAPRANRRANSAAAARQACYFDENKQMDEAGASIIKAVGVYSPGSLVRLANQEVGVVVRRGANTTAPRVAVLLNRDGLPAVEQRMRDTVQPETRVTASLAPHECKVSVNLERMLALTSGRGLY